MSCSSHQILEIISIPKILTILTSMKTTTSIVRCKHMVAAVRLRNWNCSPFWNSCSTKKSVLLVWWKKLEWSLVQKSQSTHTRKLGRRVRKVCLQCLESLCLHCRKKRTTSCLNCFLFNLSILRSSSSRFERVLFDFGDVLNWIGNSWPCTMVKWL